MPSLASGNRSCTAWAITCAVEWRRIARAVVGCSMRDRLDLVPVGERGGQVAQLAVDPGGDDGAGRGHPAGSVGRQQAPGGRASLRHMLASGEGDAKLLG